MLKPRRNFLVSTWRDSLFILLKMSCLDERLLGLCFPVAREQLAVAQGKAARLCDANTVLTEAEHDHDAVAANSSATVVRVGQY